VRADRAHIQALPVVDQQNLEGILNSIFFVSAVPRHQEKVLLEVLVAVIIFDSNVCHKGVKVGRIADLLQSEGDLAVFSSSVRRPFLRMLLLGLAVPSHLQKLSEIVEQSLLLPLPFDA
jgi:hypothetical protein